MLGKRGFCLVVHILLQPWCWWLPWFEVKWLFPFISNHLDRYQSRFTYQVTGWFFIYLGSSHYANFITPNFITANFITAIFQNFPDIFGCCIFWVVSNHVKQGVSLRILYCVVDTTMGLADLWGIANLHCWKVESTKWLKHKLRATLGGQ